MFMIYFNVGEVVVWGGVVWGVGGRGGGGGRIHVLKEEQQRAER